MNKYIEIIKDIVEHYLEEEWFEFKENWFEAHVLVNIYLPYQMQLYYAVKNFHILFGG